MIALIFRHLYFPMDFRALVIDLDGTLLIGESLPPANRDALMRAIDAGMDIIIATARWRQMAERIAQQLGIGSPIIACSGAQVYVPAEGRDIFDYRLEPGATGRLYDICNRRQCMALAVLDDAVVMRTDTDIQIPGLATARELSLEHHGGVRMAIVQGSDAIGDIRRELRRGDVNVFDAVGPDGGALITITARQANKGTALRAACAHLNIEPEATVTFGDAENDTEMFKVSGASVAMGQATDEVKRAATYVTGSNEDLGVAQAIDRLLRLGSL